MRPSFTRRPTNAFSLTSKEGLLTIQCRNQNTLFPVLTNFRHTSPCRKSNRDHGLQWGLPTTGKEQINVLCTVTADPQVVNCNRFSYQQVIHIPRSPQALKKYLTSVRHVHNEINNTLARLSPMSTFCQTDSSITRTKISPPSPSSQLPNSPRAQSEAY